jgi:voltage-gated potassium channel
MDLSPGTESAFLAIDYLIWAVFAAEYAIKLYLAPNRRQFIAHHIPDLIIVLVPMLRPLRVLRSVRLLRLCASPCSPVSPPKGSGRPATSFAIGG